MLSFAEFLTPVVSDINVSPLSEVEPVSVLFDALGYLHYALVQMTTSTENVTYTLSLKVNGTVVSSKSCDSSKGFSCTLISTINGLAGRVQIFVNSGNNSLTLLGRNRTEGSSILFPSYFYRPQTKFGAR